MVLRKTEILPFDTNMERKRIKKAFKDDPVTQKKLYELMDLVEKQDWQKAIKVLQSKWWMGRDKKYECSRYEFIGYLTDNWEMGYLDLIINCYKHPDIYKIQ